MKREQQLKAEKLAASCLDSKTPDIYGDLAKISGSGRNLSFCINEISDNIGAVNTCNEYHSEIYNYVGFDEEEMHLL